MPKMVDITGQRFGRWTVKARAPNRTTSGSFALTYWFCKCQCGNTKEVRAASLIRGKSKSCGCLCREFHASLVTHGETRRGRGRMTRQSTEYQAWQNMLGRCRNSSIPGYHNYGGRGITVCERWTNSFEAFLQDMGRRPTRKHSLDRIDVNQGYSKSNCRWTTADVQIANRRKIAAISQFTVAELKAELRRREITPLLPRRQ